jgi:hypothetical protein
MFFKALYLRGSVTRYVCQFPHRLIEYDYSTLIDMKKFHIFDKYGFVDFFSKKIYKKIERKLKPGTQDFKKIAYLNIVRQSNN